MATEGGGSGKPPIGITVPRRLIHDPKPCGSVRHSTTGLGMPESPKIGFIEMGFVTSGLNNDDGTIAKGLPNSSPSSAGSGRGCGSPPKLESLNLAAAAGEEEELLLLLLRRSLKQNVLNEGPCKGPGSEEDSVASVQLETSVPPRAESCSSSSSRWAKSLADPAVLKCVDLESDGRNWGSGLEHERLEGTDDHRAVLAGFLRAKNFRLIDGEWKKLEGVEEEEFDVVELRISSRDWVLPASFHEDKLCGDPGA